MKLASIGFTLLLMVCAHAPAQPATQVAIPASSSKNASEAPRRLTVAQVEEGVVGATCYAKPSCPECMKITTNDPAPGTNACTHYENFYPGLTMAVAKEHAIKKCQELNALDECGNHCKDGNEVRRKSGGGCYAQCAEKTHCIYGDNR
jgi:hypothetical protein